MRILAIEDFVSIRTFSLTEVIVASGSTLLARLEAG